LWRAEEVPSRPFPDFGLIPPRGVPIVKGYGLIREESLDLTHSHAGGFRPNVPGLGQAPPPKLAGTPLPSTPPIGPVRLGPGPVQVETDPGPAAPLRAGMALLILLTYVIGQGVGGAIAYFALKVAGAGRITSAESLAIDAVGVVLGGLLMFLLTKQMLPGRTLKEKMGFLGWKPVHRRELWRGAGCALGVCLFVAPLVAMLFPPGNHTLGPVARTAMSSNGALAIYALIAIFLAPPIEEFLFRGVVFTGLSKSWGVPAASVAATLVFTAAHLPQMMGYLPGLLLIATVGALTLFLRRRTDSLLPGMVLHSTYNSLVVLIVLLTR
jgi:membrane protease YdiL (CAAX protease family)